MRKTVGELLGFLAGKDSGTEIEILGTNLAGTLVILGMLFLFGFMLWSVR